MTSNIAEQHTSHKLAIIVIIFNMRREAPRTLYSLSADYQTDVSPEDYDVIVVENGSSEPMSSEEVEQFGSNFHYLPIRNASPSPAAAINLAVSQTNTEFVGIMIDGARMASPGIISLALKSLTSFERPIVGTVSFHLGPDIQPRSVCRGYTQEVEDELLSSIDWRKNGYGLFEISTLAGSSYGGRFGKIAEAISPLARIRSRGWLRKSAENIRALSGISESNLIFLPRVLFDELEGFDERFDLPGGGLVSSDFYQRACDLKNTTLITLSGVATFHQIHGGTMTNKPKKEGTKELNIYKEQFRKIRGVPFKTSKRIPIVVGFSKPQTTNKFSGKYDLQYYVDPESRKIKVLLFILAGARRLKHLSKNLLSKIKSTRNL